jgi:hypothetical protein
VQKRREIADTTSPKGNKIQQSKCWQEENLFEKKFRNQRRRFALQLGKAKRVFEGED